MPPACDRRISTPRALTSSRAIRTRRARDSTRLSGSESGSVGGGGPNAVPASGDTGPGRPGGGGSGALGDVPGGIRNVSPANDNATDPDHIHEGQGQNRSERTNHIRAGNPGTDDEH